MRCFQKNSQIQAQANSKSKAGALVATCTIIFLFLVYFCLLSWDRLLLCSPSWPGTCYVKQADFELVPPPIPRAGVTAWTTSHTSSLSTLSIFDTMMDESGPRSLVFATLSNIAKFPHFRKSKTQRERTSVILPRKGKSAPEKGSNFSEFEQDDTAIRGTRFEQDATAIGWTRSFSLSDFGV